MLRGLCLRERVVRLSCEILPPFLGPGFVPDGRMVLKQVLSKSFKIVPIMIMGKILGNKEYPFYDYVVAGVIALGITLFLVRQGEGEGEGKSRTLRRASCCAGIARMPTC